MAVALVEPFRLHTHFAKRGAAISQAHAEHFHAVGQGICLQGGMHRVAGAGRSKMRQARACQVHMRRIRVGDRQGKTAFIRHAGQINRVAQAMFGNHGGKAAPAGCGL